MSVTARLPRTFNENFYLHSYVEMDDDKVLDLTLNILMDKKEFESLVKPTKCFCCKNKNVKAVLDECMELVGNDPDAEQFLDCNYHRQVLLSAFEQLKKDNPEKVSEFKANMSQPS